MEKTAKPQRPVQQTADVLQMSSRLSDVSGPLEKPDEISALLAAIVENSDDAIISATLDGTIMTWNRGAEHIFGYKANEVKGHSTSLLASLNAEDDPARVLDRIRQGHRVEHYETLRRHKDGSDIIVSLTVSPVRDSSGNLVGISKVARDITSTRRAAKSLRNADKLALVGRMAASITHEINNPLEAVTNLLYLIEHENIPDQARSYLNIAQKELTRVSHIVSQTLGFFRGSLVPALCSIPEILDSALSLHAGRVLVAGIKVETRYRPTQPLLAQQGEIRQVLANLVGNALDAMPRKGRLLLRVRSATSSATSARGIRLTIADTGVGMSHKTREQIFEPFYTTKEATGTGLGLWVTRQIVDRHQGSIKVRTSQSPDHHGSVFSIFLPYMQNPDALMMAEQVQSIPSPASPTPLTSPEDESRRTPAEPDSRSVGYSAA